MILASTAISFAVAEVVFRGYESRFLLTEIRGGDAVYDLGALGYNDGRVEGRKGKEEFRILSFGDSFTWSVVDFPYSWNGILQRALTNERRTVRVVNLGVSDRTFDSYVEQARFWTRQLEHDGVVFQAYAGNDFADAIGARRVHRDLRGDVVRERLARAESGPVESALLAGPGTRVPRRFQSRILDYASALFWTWRSGSTAAPEFLDTTQIPLDRYVTAMSVASHPYWDRSISLHLVVPGYSAAIDFLRMADELQRSGTRVLVIVSAPAFFFQPKVESALREMGVDVDRLDLDLPAVTLAALARLESLEVDIVDPARCMLADPDAQDLYYGTNTHWGLKGNRVVGELLAAYLREAWWGETPRAGDRSCRLAPVQPPAPNSARALYARRIHRATRLERRARATVESVRERQFDSPSDFEAGLEALGARRATQAAEGWVERIQPREIGPEEPPTVVTGWLRDGSGGDAPAVIVALHRGRLVGWAATRGPRAGAAAPVDGPALDYAVPVMVTCDELAADASLWLYGIAGSGRYVAIRTPSGLACAGP